MGMLFILTPDELMLYYRELTELSEQYIESVDSLRHGIEKLKNSWEFDQNPQIAEIEERLEAAKQFYPQLLGFLDTIKKCHDTFLQADSIADPFCSSSDYAIRNGPFPGQEKP